MPPANPIWIHFNKLGQVSGFQQPHAQCKYCNYEINAAVGKCVAHFKICSRVSITTLRGYFGPNFQINEESEYFSSSSSSGNEEGNQESDFYDSDVIY